MINNLMAVALLGGLALASFITGAEFGDPLRRGLRALARKVVPPHPGGHQAPRTSLVAGPAPLPDGEAQPVLGDRMISEVRREWDAGTSHADVMWQASEPYLPLPVRADRPVTPVRAGPAPWTGETPALDEEALTELDRARWVRSQLPARAEDVTREDMERALASLRAVPAARALEGERRAGRVIA